MLLIVTWIGFLIHVYATGYMAHEEGYTRFFAYLNLFMFMMLLLVLGANYLVMFVGWEGVGLCSYLLIGFYYDKNFAADAGKKAFIVNRIGDFGFVLGIFLIFNTFGTADYAKVFALASANPARVRRHRHDRSACCSSSAPAASRAQIPLYVWLPDAMAGPTPVSALIHAATMVTAGVYMVVALERPLPALADGDAGRRDRRRGHRDLRRHDRHRAERHQEGARVLDRLAARLHVPGLRRRRVHRGDLPRR